MVALEPREFRLLEGLRFNPRKSFSGKIRGERLTQKKGISIEFSDYREYSDGDDLRHLDWNVLARLETPIMKTYRDEEDLAIHILLDGSASMEFGEPSKAEVASKFAAMFGYVGLSGGDAIYARRLGEQPLPALRGRSSMLRLSKWCEREGGDGSESLTVHLRKFANSSARTGLAVIISDGMDPIITSAIRAIGGRGHELLFLQILSDIELDPDIEGDLRLIDSEGTSKVEITANSFALKAYRENLKKHNETLKEAVLRVGGRHALITNSTTVEKAMATVLKRDGWFV